MFTEFESAMDATQANTAYRPLDKSKSEIRLFSITSTKDGIKGR
jgi:hypothetical protein